MKKHAYLIMAHNHFDLLQTLLRLLDDERNDIFVHIDKKVLNFKYDHFEHLCQKARLIFTEKRVDVRWGTQSQVKTEMLLFSTAYAYGPYHYYHLISGVCLPLHSQEEIHRFLEDKQESYLYYDEAPSVWDKQRISRYHGLFPGWFPFKQRLNFLATALQNQLRVDRTKGKMRVLKGSNWGTLTQQAVQILIENKNEIMKMTRFSVCADEVYKQTILYAKDCPMLRNDMRLTIWSHENHPKVFTMTDLPTLEQSDRLFARKFDPTVDSEIIQKIVQRVSDTGNG